jgi:hypothetical protein
VAVEVVDRPVGDRPGHALGVAVGVEAELDLAGPEADVVGLVDVRLGPEQGGIQGLGLGQVLDGMDDDIDGWHGGLLSSPRCHIGRVRPVTTVTRPDGGL